MGVGLVSVKRYYLAHFVGQHGQIKRNSAPRNGFGPLTSSLTERRSTVELPRNIKEQANYNNSCLQGKVANGNISNIIAKSKGFFQKRRHLAMMKKSLPKISNN